MIKSSCGAGFRILYAASVLLFAGTAAYGQVDTGTILGVVTDATGASVAGATVVAQNQETSFSRTEQTDASGRYQIQSLPLGAYSVTVQQAGFKTEERHGVTLSVGSQVALNIQLAVGSAQDKVEVTADAPAVETANATVSQLTTGAQVRDLPLNGRSMDELAGLTPGMYVDKSSTASASISFGARMSINGGQPDMMLFLLDGTVINDPSGGAPISAARGMLGVEGILEFRMLTHTFSAEYGRVGGGVMSMVTRSGSNDFHGSAYEFLRNNAMDSRNFFDQDPNTHGALPAYRRNQFGGSVGGPIRKDKLFFFVNYEGLRQVQGNPIVIPVPDLNARQGLLPCATVPTATCNPTTGLAPTPVNPTALPFVNLYPLPNGAEIGGGTANYLTTFFAHANENYTMARVDYRISDKDNFYGRYVYNPSNLQVPRPVPIWGELDQSHPHYVVLSETHILSSSSLNEFRVSFNRVAQAADGITFANLDPSITVVPGQGLAQIQFSSLVTTGGQLPALGTNFGRPQSYPQNTFQEADTFSHVHGAHSLKFGVDVERIQINLNQTSGNTRGSETFGGLAALLAGTPSSISLTLPGAGNQFERGDRRSIIGLFVQDDFRIRPNLTLNIGLREDLFTTPTEVNGYMGELINLTDPAETPGKPFISPWNTLSPRVGLAWDPFGDGKTSVRVGGGIYYDPIDGRSYYQASLGGNLWLNSVKVTNPPFPNALANGATAVLPSVTAIQYRPQNATNVNYNVEIQRQLTRDLALHVAYVGSVSDHLLRTTNWDTRFPTIMPNGMPLYPATGPLLNPNFSSIMFESSDGRANYNGLQTSLVKRLAAGLQLSAAFTYSKAMSNTDQAIANMTVSTPSSTMNPINLNEDYAESVYSERYHFVSNGSYNLPFGKSLTGLAKKLATGWAINAIYVYGSGHPQTVIDGFNNSRTGDTNSPDRPNLNPGFTGSLTSGSTTGCGGTGGISPGQLHTATRWFDPCAFSLPPAGTFGNVSRDSIIAPGINNVDFALVKDTAITERIKLQFRGEIFNLLNHAQFSLPNNTVFTSTGGYSSSAGQITATSNDNREIQLGLKLIF